MAVRSIRTFGDPVLRVKARDVTDFDRELRRLVADLYDTMYDASGVGLAANQIGVTLRVFSYVTLDPDDPERLLARHLVNPMISERSDDEVEDEEGCLSVPGLYYRLKRPRRVVASGFNMHGEPVEVEGTERLARALQHETDHLDGVLFLDKLDSESRKDALRILRERALDGEPLPDVRRSPHPPLG